MTAPLASALALAVAGFALRRPNVLNWLLAIVANAYAAALLWGSR